MNTDKPTTTASVSQNDVEEHSCGKCGRATITDETGALVCVACGLEWDVETASATPDKVRRIRLTPQRVAELEKLAAKRTSEQLADARKHLPDIDATLEAMRTIPAEKPIAIKTSQPYAQELAKAKYAASVNPKFVNVCVNHADKLAEAARCALADLEGIMPEFDASGNRTHPAWQTIAELKQALAAYESEVGQ